MYTVMYINRFMNVNHAHLSLCIYCAAAHKVYSTCSGLLDCSLFVFCFFVRFISRIGHRSRAYVGLKIPLKINSICKNC